MDFWGLTTSDGKEDHLFPIQTTGVSTQPIKSAGEAFLKGLAKEQLAKTCFDIQDDEWRRWCNVVNGANTRQGISSKEMNQQHVKAILSIGVKRGYGVKQNRFDHIKNLN